MPGVSFLFHQPTQENIDESFSGLPAFFGITLIGGLLVGMFFSLNLIPVLYDGLARRFEKS